MDVRVTDYLDVSKWLSKKLKAQGSGATSRFAKALAVPTSYVSQMISGLKPLTTDRGFQIARYFRLNRVETEYLIALVQYKIAKTADARDFFEIQLKSVRAKNLQLEMSKHAAVDENASNLYFSTWYYAGIFLLASIPGFQLPTKISQRLSLPLDVVVKVLDFLVEIGLCKISGSEYRIITNRIHIRESELTRAQHHLNWRLKSLEKINKQDIDDFYFSVPMTISKKDRDLVRTMLVDFLNKLDSVIEKSADEELVCLNIDWFGV